MAEKETFQESQLPTLREEVKTLTITDPDSYQYADTRLALIKGGQKYFKELYRVDIANSKVTYDGLRNKLAGFIDPLEEDERTIKDLMVGYNTEQRKIAEKRALELQREERLKAEQEALEVAALLESVGQKEEAETVLERPEQQAPVVVKPGTPKSSTSHLATQWKYEMENFSEFAAAVVNGLTGWRNNKRVTYWVFVQVEGEEGSGIPENSARNLTVLPLASTISIKALDYSKDFLNRQTTAQKGTLNYPGVRVYPKDDIRSRS